MQPYIHISWGAFAKLATQLDVANYVIEASDLELAPGNIPNTVTVFNPELGTSHVFRYDGIRQDGTVMYRTDAGHRLAVLND